MAALLSADGIIALVTLTAMEIVLGIDNVVFLAILAGRLPERQQALARRIGITLALGIRIGLFLIAKATWEVYDKLEGESAEPSAEPAPGAFVLVIVQILLLDIVFSLDSVITAVGMANQIAIMVIAMVLAMLVMLGSVGGVT